LRRELNQARQALAERHRLDLLRRRSADLGLLAAGLAHELGQPLTVARVDLEGLNLLRASGRDPGPAQVDRILARLAGSIQAMSQTVGHLRDLAGDGGLRQERLDLRQVVDGILGQIDRWGPAAAGLVRWEPPAEPVLVLGDALGIHLILVNLVRNAVEAAEDLEPERRGIRIVLGPGPRLVVEDQGIGIAPEALESIFDPFVSDKPGVSGTVRGLGLALARASADRMGAHLEVRSTVGVGTAFTLMLAAG
jgi:signal transduction histidine kinase